MNNPRRRTPGCRRPVHCPHFRSRCKHSYIPSAPSVRLPPRHPPQEPRLPPTQPDFSVVERTWESRLRQRGLTPSRVGAGVATGYDKFEIHRQETQAGEFDIDSLGHGFLGSIEIAIRIDAPGLGAYDIHDLVTQRGPSPDGAPAVCANTF